MSIYRLRSFNYLPKDKRCLSKARLNLVGLIPCDMLYSKLVEQEKDIPTPKPSTSFSLGLHELFNRKGVYAWKRATGEYLYIGISDNLGKRIFMHDIIEVKEEIKPV